MMLRKKLNDIPALVLSVCVHALPRLAPHALAEEAQILRQMRKPEAVTPAPRQLSWVSLVQHNRAGRS